MSIALTLHVLAVVIWVGGMFFAYMALRPAAASTLEPPQLLPLWAKVFRNFFPWVWISILLILGSGYWMLLGPFGGMANAPVFIHIMQTLGLIMMLIFGHLYFALFPKLKRTVANAEWPEAKKTLGKIRRIIAINLSIGLVTTIVASGGKFFI